MDKFTKDSTLGEIIKTDGAIEVLGRHSVPCPTCPMAAMEMDKLTIGMVCETYGLNLEDILSDLNR
jgi:hypothetical protein